MPNPIQIVLESSNFLKDLEPPQGSSKTDFFQGRDVEFAAHKTALVSQIGSIRNIIQGNEYSTIGYAKVLLTQSALAKVHRPTKQLLPEAVVGGGDLGVMYVEVQPSRLDALEKKILKAEPSTSFKDDKEGNPKVNPSRLRSEVGAIEEIQAYTASDKRSFSTSEGVEWLANGLTGGTYIVELFRMPPPRYRRDALSPEREKLFGSFEQGLQKFGRGLRAVRLLDDVKFPIIGIRLEISQDKPLIQLDRGIPFDRRFPSRSSRVDLNFERHEKLLHFLDRHPLVKRVSLPPIIETTAGGPPNRIGLEHVIPIRSEDKTYPMVGVVDGGISSLLGNWVQTRYGFLSDEHRQESHGTFIGGLLVSSRTINGSDVYDEADGCAIVDIDLLPKGEFFEDYYGTSPLELFTELGNAIDQLKRETGTRIINFSLNFVDHVTTTGYSNAAKLLDQIAEEHDVIFVVSAGNINSMDFRNEWPTDPIQALSILAKSRNDSIRPPAESCRNLSVAAVNPPGVTGFAPHAPSSYSCRGPGIRSGTKPDLAHVGGANHQTNSGLLSMGEEGKLVSGRGTSYAAPHVAKTIASLDSAIEGYTSRETLMALVTHRADLPSVLAGKELVGIVRDVIGFGIPNSSEQILNGEDSSITLVFANRIRRGQKLSFKFLWPDCLVVNGKCRGKAKLTLVSTPPIDYDYGAEFVRINIDAALRQEQPDGTYKGHLVPIYHGDKSQSSKKEKNQIINAFKWATTKVYQKSFPIGIGKSTNWALEVESLVRDGEVFPDEGVPFTALLTISGITGKEPVFTQMHQHLQAMGVKIAAIQTAARISTRV